MFQSLDMSLFPLWCSWHHDLWPCPWDWNQEAQQAHSAPVAIWLPPRWFLLLIDFQPVSSESHLNLVQNKYPVTSARGKWNTMNFISSGRVVQQSVGKNFCREKQSQFFCWTVVSLAAHTRADLQACQAGFSLPGTTNALSFYLPIISA